MPDSGIFELSRILGGDRLSGDSKISGTREGIYFYEQETRRLKKLEGTS